MALRTEGLLAALADAPDHSGGKICALTLREDASYAECELTLSLPLEPGSCPNDGAVDAAGRCGARFALHDAIVHDVSSSKQALGRLENASASWPIPQRLFRFAVA